MKQYRQGDVFVKEISQLPEIEDSKYQSVEGDSIEGMIILAHGEVTGHKHAIRDYGARLVKAKEKPHFYLVVDNTVALLHEEHTKIKFPEGKYRVVRQREYTPEGIRPVAD